ncbi:hypothetical protein BBI01_07250 [Chryseobacterium artocarpi]|uniref:Uncharacterized protein n=1 Tax=Chryseobacterium artocarpi TaxID=1414727 RepID=A0A1B8ZK24_9FLAO|nr:hypothetical protein [Chryseobacterium artocarpi]OCA71945.1 hypothetical protein BBI01_07250 [Chryseobacterium artocarpi]
MKNNKIDNISLEKSEYIFKPYKAIYISNTPSEIDNRLYINEEIWTWPKAGRIYSLDWKKKNLPDNLKELFKGFIFHRFQNNSSTSIYSMDLSLINFFM